MACGLEARLPLIIHNREATPDCLGILREYRSRSPRGVFHCFSGSKETTRECLEMGFYLSFAGPVTFPNTHHLREVVKSVPVERLLLETDCPYLLPQPQRGKRNEPAYLRYLLPILSQLYNLAEEDIARITTFNAFQLFGMGTNHQEGKVAYTIRNSLYLNITGRCPNTCSFCHCLGCNTCFINCCRIRRRKNYSRFSKNIPYFTPTATQYRYRYISPITPHNR